MTDRRSLASSARARVRAVLPRRDQVAGDAVAGVPGAVASVPDGMAASVLVGVSPIHGLIASFVGPVAGGLTASTSFMVIATTSASALAAGSVLTGVSPGDRESALFLLTALAGAFMVVGGVLRLGRYTRFVSHSVMMGFLTGVAVNIVLGQLPDLTGTSANGSSSVAKALNVVTDPRSIDGASLLVGLAAVAILIGLSGTRLRSVSSVVALVVPTMVAALADLDVARVSDLGDIPQGVPLPAMPELSQLTIGLVTGALSVAIIVLVQGAGVGESVANPDGSPSDASVDFAAQGWGNIASGLFQGQPVGGSVGQTAMNVSAGARSRWASIFSGFWMLAILVALAGVVGKVAVPTLAAVLIVAAAGAIRTGEVATVWSTGWPSRIVIGTTLVSTLFLPIQVAVGIGVVLSALLQLNADSFDVAVVELVPRPDGLFEERPVPDRLRSDDVMILDVHGSLFFAGARTLEERLPDPRGSHRPAVVIRLRGRTALGATFFKVMEGYVDQVRLAGGRVFLSGVDPALRHQYRHAGRVSIGVGEALEVFEATAVLSESSVLAYRRAREWLAEDDQEEEQP